MNEDKLSRREFLKAAGIGMVSVLVINKIPENIETLVENSNNAKFFDEDIIIRIYDLDGKEIAKRPLLDHEIKILERDEDAAIYMIRTDPFSWDHNVQLSKCRLDTCIGGGSSSCNTRTVFNEMLTAVIEWEVIVY